MERTHRSESDCRATNGQPAPRGAAVIVVDGYSTGRFYAPELKNRGYRPYHLASGTESVSIPLSNWLAHAGNDMKRDYEGMLGHEGDLEATARSIADLRPAAILAGCECAVELSDALAERLCLPGNSTVSTPVRRDKHLMQQALAEAGLRSIKGVMTDSLEDLLAFAESLPGRPVVLKPLRSTGTEGVHFCHTPEQLRSAFLDLMGRRSFLGEINDAVLVQELVQGREVVVNTVSAGGRHCLSDVWVYNKIINEGAPVYEHVRLAVRLEEELQAAVDYSLAVLDALGIRQGPAHAEIMISETGPVLVECAARPMGGGFPQNLVRECLGHTQVEWAIDSYLDSEAFERHLAEPYQPKKHFLVKYFISTRQGELASIPSVTLLSGLKSTRYGDFAALFERNRVERTVDLFTSPADLCLCHEDEAVLTSDANLIRELELEAQNELFELAPDCTRAAISSDWFAHIPDAFWLKTEEEAAWESRLIARTLNVTDGLELLDCPCGDCRMGVHLAMLGVKYTGVDLNPRFIEKAGERFSLAGVHGNLSAKDMRDIDFTERFDVVLNWFNSFGYFGIEEDFEILKRLVRALKPAGRMLLEAPNRRNILSNIRAKKDREGKPLAPIWDEVTEQVILEVPPSGESGMQSVVIGTRMYSLNQMKLLFRLAGMQVTRIWGEGFSDFGEDSQRMILLAEKM